MDGITERSKRKRFIILTNYNMTKVKSQCCSKEDATKDIKKKLWENEFTITLHIGEDSKIGIELECKWDEDKATDYFVEWFRFGSISTLLSIGKELLGDDVRTIAQVIKDLLDQLHYWTKDEFGITDKEEAINKFKELYEKSIKEDSNED